jgi:hypothetical protein
MQALTEFYENVYERLLGEINTKDDLEIRLGDTLDVKTSIGLVVITFLATQTAYFLDKSVSGVPHTLQIVSAFLLAIATIAAFVELWPRTYIVPLPESSGIDRATELREFYAQHENIEASAMLAEFTKNQIGWAQTRILTNEKNNEQKTLWLQISFYLTAVAMALNIITLFYFRTFFDAFPSRLRGRRWCRCAVCCWLSRRRIRRLCHGAPFSQISDCLLRK